MLRAFLFDFNATLIRSVPWMELEIRGLPGQAFAYLAEQGYISPLDADQMAKAEAVFKAERQAANISWQETSHVDNLTRMVEVLHLQSQVSSQVIEATVAALQRRCVPTVEQIESATETVQQLQTQGYRLGIISNAAYGPFLRWTLEHLGLLPLFEEIVVSADVGLRKPGLEIFRLTIERMGLTPAEAVYVGDDFRKDVVAAKELGLRAIWYRPEGVVKDVADETIPDVIVTHLSQIPVWGERWRA